MITICAILVPIVSSLSFIPNSSALIVVTAVILLFGVGAGMMIVPLNSLMQAHSPEDGLGSMLAGKNWIDQRNEERAKLAPAPEEPEAAA